MMPRVLLEFVLVNVSGAGRTLSGLIGATVEIDFSPPDKESFLNTHRQRHIFKINICMVSHNGFESET